MLLPGVLAAGPQPRATIATGPVARDGERGPHAESDERRQHCLGRSTRADFRA